MPAKQRAKARGRYRTFTRTWWEDFACTMPGAGPKRFTGKRYDTEEEAREACRLANAKRGPTGRGHMGLATEFEEV